MGSALDCCISDTGQHVRHEYEGVMDMDIGSTDAVVLDTTNNPSIYTYTKSASLSDDEPSPPDMSISAVSRSCSKKKKKKKKSSKTSRNGGLQIEINMTPSQAAMDVYDSDCSSYSLSKYRIVVSPPVSPIQASFMQQKMRDEFSICVNGILRFYYFDFTDVACQQSILGDRRKQLKCMQLVNNGNGGENLGRWLKKKLFTTDLADKLWYKFTEKHKKKVVDTHEMAEFLSGPVVLYKRTKESMQAHKQKSSSDGVHLPAKLSKQDRMSIKHDLEHLAMYIIQTYGEKQVNGSCLFTLTKQMYDQHFAEYIDEYIQCYDSRRPM